MFVRDDDYLTRLVGITHTFKHIKKEMVKTDLDSVLTPPLTQDDAEFKPVPKEEDDEIPYDFETKSHVSTRAKPKLLNPGQIQSLFTANRVIDLEINDSRLPRLQV